MNVIIARLDGQVLHLPLLGLVLDDQLRLHDLKRHHRKYQATRDLPHRSIICIYELDILMVLQNEIKGPTKLPKMVTGIVWINGVELHVGGLCEGGNVVAHKPPEEGTDLIKG